MGKWITLDIGDRKLSEVERATKLIKDTQHPNISLCKTNFFSSKLICILKTYLIKAQT